MLKNFELHGLVRVRPEGEKFNPNLVCPFHCCCAPFCCCACPRVLSLSFTIACYLMLLA